MSVEAFLQSMVEDPASAATTWLMLADWLEERDDPRFELVRLHHDPHYLPDLSPLQRQERASQLLAAGVRLCVPTWTNSVGMEFALVPAGTFWMGGGGGQPGDRQVEIAADFFLGIYPVTQEQWQLVMGKNPSWFSRTGRGKDQVQDISEADLKQFPVEQVSWEDVQEFIKKLNESENKSSWEYRLPTEEEWEYACRGAVCSKEECSCHYYLTSPSNSLSSTQANFNGNYPAGEAARGPYLGRPTKVGSYPSNRLGLHDLHGNVWEWTSSRYESGASRRVLRGGSWYSPAEYCRVAYRHRFAPGYRGNNFGFRLAAVRCPR